MRTRGEINTTFLIDAKLKDEIVRVFIDLNSRDAPLYGDEITSTFFEDTEADYTEYDTAEFELSYRNEISLTSVDIEVREIMDHVTASLESFVIEEDPEEDIEAQIEAEEADAVQQDQAAE